MNVFVMKGVWKPLQAWVLVCRCLSGWKHPLISVFAKICRCWVVCVGGLALGFPTTPPFAAAAVAADTVGHCLALPHPSEKKG